MLQLLLRRSKLNNLIFFFLDFSCSNIKRVHCKIKLFTVITRKFLKKEDDFQNQVIALKSVMSMRNSNCADETVLFHLMSDLISV